MTGLLTGALPDTVRVSGRTWPVRTDYRVWLELITVMNGDLPPGEKLARVLTLCYPAVPEDLPAAVEALAWFFRCGAPAPGQEDAAGTSVPLCFSPEEDAALLTASFQQAYGMDLTAERVHWWRFRALLEGLPEETVLCRVMSLRAADERDLQALDPGLRQQLRRLKRRYRLKRRQPESLSARDAGLMRYVAARLDGKEG